MRFFSQDKDEKKKRVRARFRLLSLLLILGSFFLFFSFVPFLLFSQVSYNGMPVSFKYEKKKSPTEITLRSPDSELLHLEDEASKKNGTPERVGISVKADINLIQEDYLEVLPDGTHSWRIQVVCKGANAMGLYFDDFQMIPGCRVFAYNEDRSLVKGSYI
jgi:lysyl endopeptidase